MSEDKKQTAILENVLGKLDNSIIIYLKVKKVKPLG